MNVNRLENFVGGWFVGNFTPSLLKSTAFEVAIKRYKARDREQSHHHNIATEFTAIIDGEVAINGIHYVSGDIITIDPKESAQFTALTDVVTCVVKSPSVKNDKFIDYDTDLT